MGVESDVCTWGSVDAASVRVTNSSGLSSAEGVRIDVGVGTSDISSDDGVGDELTIDPDSDSEYDEVSERGNGRF